MGRIIRTLMLPPAGELRLMLPMPIPPFTGDTMSMPDPGLVYADYDEPALAFSTYANEPTYQRRYAYTTSVRSPRYSRAYVPTYRNSYAYAPSRARQLSS